MIVSQLKGGLGNQLFEYAYGLSQAKRLNTELRLDNSVLINTPPTWTKYKYELDCFNIDLNETNPQNGLKLVVENSDGKYRDYNIQDNSYLDGYWQGEIFFENIKDELRKKLKFKGVQFKVDIDTLKYAVSIHARRGDYLNGSHFIDLSKTNYYQKAIEHIKTKIKEPIFQIFSNDKDWAEKYFSFITTDTKLIINPISTVDDLYWMSLCEHNITANSTYSWWAGWLNKNSDKIVIQPKQWYGIKETQTELYLKDAVLI